MPSQKRYVLVGTGGRAAMFVDALVHEFPQNATLAGICDLSQVRMDWHNLRIKELFKAKAIPTYLASRFDEMVKETKADGVIVTSMDCTHDQYIVRAMELGCDVISEKPMTTEAGKVRGIFDAIARTGKKLRVTHNYRYTPFATKVRELMMSGVVGRPMLVHFSWMLDTSHGADYFRRWHSEKDKSGGLQIHKASHHFDIANWWVGSYPKTVFAQGNLGFYGEAAAAGRGEKYSYKRYTNEPAAKGDPFALTLDGKDSEFEKLSVSGLKGLYLNAETETGYLRDKNVFGSHVTIEDTLSVNVKYRSGTLMTYSLVAYSPWEGLKIDITGDKGRIEVYSRHGSHIITGAGEKALAAQQAKGKMDSIRVFPMFGVPYDVEAPKATGAHGGGDELMLREIFAPDGRPDPFGRAATHIDGAAAVLVGIAVNESLRTGRAVECDDLIKLPG